MGWVRDIVSVRKRERGGEREGEREREGEKDGESERERERRREKDKAPQRPIETSKHTIDAPPPIPQPRNPPTIFDTKILVKAVRLLVKLGIGARSASESDPSTEALGDRFRDGVAAPMLLLLPLCGLILAESGRLGPEPALTREGAT